MACESPDILKKNLLSIISDMQAVSHLFVKQPEKDFSSLISGIFLRTWYL